MTLGERTRCKGRRPRLSDEAAAHVREPTISGQLTGGKLICPTTVANELDISATPADVRALTNPQTGLDAAAEHGQ